MLVRCMQYESNVKWHVKALEKLEKDRPRHVEVDLVHTERQR